MKQHPYIICPDRAAWLKSRQKSLGASDAASVLGLSSWKSNTALWDEKTGRSTPKDISEKPYVQYGVQAEPLLRDFFALDHPEYTVHFTPFKIFRHPDKPFLTCTPDGELTENKTGDAGGLEIKTTEIHSASGWERWKDRIPDAYYAQICHQMLVTGWEFVELLAQIKFTTIDGDDRKETRHYRFEHEDCLEDIRLLEREETRFWNCIQAGKRPALKLPLPSTTPKTKGVPYGYS